MLNNNKLLSTYLINFGSKTKLVIFLDKLFNSTCKDFTYKSSSAFILWSVSGKLRVGEMCFGM